MAPLCRTVSSLLGALTASYATVAFAETGGITDAARRELANARLEMEEKDREKEARWDFMSPVAVGRRLNVEDDRRHASAHLRYEFPNPGGQYQSWFAQINPKHSTEDTYFSVLGQEFGYMGLQQLEARGFFFEGKAIFSIWDKGCADVHDSNACPEANRAQVVECGERAICTRFGGEGTGAKSYMPFHVWDIEEPYGFLVQTIDLNNGWVEYRGYFQAQEMCEDSAHNGWMLLSRLKVKLGDKQWTLNGLYSFTEQWSKRSGHEPRWMKVGPMFMEPAYADQNKNDWAAVTRATFHHTTHHTERVTNVNGNVTNFGQQWGLGTGGQIVKTSHQGQMLQLTNPLPEPEPLIKFIELRRTNNLPSGCLGGTCKRTLIQEWFKSWLGKKWFFMFAIMMAIMGIMACTGCGYGVKAAKDKIVGKGKVAPGGPAARQLNGPPPGYPGGVPPGAMPPMARRP